MNLAMLQTLQRMAGQKDADDMDALLEEDAGELDGAISKLATGARGAAALYKLHQHIEQHPVAWSQKLDRAMWVALGCQHTNLPWSAARYFQERVNFGKHHDLERFAHLICHLHSLHRTQQHDLLGARLAQYLKAIEQTVLHNGSWRVSWSLTGVPEPKPSGSLHQGLTTPHELAATVQYLKDAKLVEELVRKETAPPFGQQSTSSGPAPQTPQNSQGYSQRQNRRRGAGRGGGGGPAPEHQQPAQK
eukprot:6489977-Amphidinium_carterae.4